MASTLCGSPLYMAPEILRGDRYDAKADLWSLGAILYELITSRPPFRAQNHIELLRKIERGDGWIRFPGEAMDETMAREYHGVTRQQRRTTIGAVPVFDVPLYVGSLGASPRFSGQQRDSPVPEDLKDVIRKLLKRNPVERISFEEFFMCQCVLANRKITTLLSSSPVPAIKDERITMMPLIYHDVESSKRLSSSLVADITSDLKDIKIEPPFPFYGAQFDISIEDIVVPEIKPMKLSIHEFPQPPEPPKSADGSSVGSSFGSFEFTDDEEERSKKITKKKGSDEFIVVEDGKGGTKIHEKTVRLDSEQRKALELEHGQVFKNSSTVPVTAAFSFSQPLKHPFSIPNQVLVAPLPRTSSATSYDSHSRRQFGSLRTNALVSRTFNPSSFQKYPDIYSILTFLPLLPVSAFEDSRINRLILFTLRAQTVTELLKVITTNEDTMAILIYSLELFEKCINFAKQITENEIPTSTAGTATIEAIIPIVNWIKQKFNENLDNAEALCDITPSNAQDVIYQCAITISKTAVDFEVKKEGGCEMGYYKSIILLESLGPLKKEEDVVVEKLLGGLYGRLHSLNK